MMSLLQLAAARHSIRCVSSLLMDQIRPWSTAVIRHHRDVPRQLALPPKPVSVQTATAIRLYHSTPSAAFIGGGGVRPPRRRRGSSPKQQQQQQQNDDPAGSTTTTTLLEFETVAVALLDEVHNAMKPLAPLNTNMVLVRGKVEDNEEVLVPSRNMQPVHNINVDPAQENNEQQQEEEEEDEEKGMIRVRGEYLLIDLGPVHGQYTIQTDVETGTMQLQSPLSGIIPYYYDPHTKDWCSRYDDHNLVGMLVRDLIRQIQGVPNL